MSSTPTCQLVDVSNRPEIYAFPYVKMAASMFRRRLCRLHSKILHFSSRTASTSYYVLLPEIPNDTPETNPLLVYGEHPKFRHLNPDNIITGCAKLAIEYDVTLGKHVEKMKDLSQEKTFKSVFDPIEQVSVPLNYSWRTAKILNAAGSEEGFRTAFQRVHPQVERSKNERWINLPLYNAVKEVAADSGNLEEYQRRLVNMYMLECRLNGIELSGSDKDKFIDFLNRLVQAKGHFRNRVMLCHNMFSYNIDDPGCLMELPKSYLSALAVDKFHPTRGPWKVTLNQSSYQPFMEYCNDRMKRWNVWQAYQNRATIRYDDQNLSNHLLVEMIRQSRREIAKLLGYENFAEMSMETKMAGSVKNVLSMIENYKTTFRSDAIEEMRVLEDYANANGAPGQLEMWDVPYWRRVYKEKVMKLDDSEVAAFFTLPKVLQGLFDLCQSLFGIDIKECTGQVDTWHTSVTFYRIFDSQDGRELASFYLDPYARQTQHIGGAWMEVGREYSAVLGTKPLSYLNLDLVSPIGNRPTTMTLQDVLILFYEFGHGLQQLLTTVPYSEVAGQRNVEWDALQVCARVMTMFLRNPAILRSLSGHVDSGEVIPDALLNKALKGQDFMHAFDTMLQLYYSAYDMEMYVSEQHWQQVMPKVWYDFVPAPLHDDDNHPCSMTAIFSDHYPAAYYSSKWAEMIAADVFKAFEEAGWENKEKIAHIGRRFRETYLSYGGSIPASEVFRRFRGRDPVYSSVASLYRNS